MAPGGHRRPARIAGLLPGLLVLLSGVPSPAAPGPATAPDAPPALAEADEGWSRRALGQVDGEPDPAPIRDAIAAYESLLERRPGDLRVRWKLLRAQYFHGDYVLADSGAKQELYARTRDLADASRRLLLERHGLSPEDPPAIVAERLAGDPDAAAIYYYSAVHWGLWGETTGRLKAARAGVAARLRDFGTVVVGIDETFEEAGGHRLLGRLHTEAPRIPLVTGWIDRDRAVAALDSACAIAPENPHNQLFLADALLRFRPERREEAIGRLERLVASAPRVEQLIEDMAAIEEGRDLLARHQRGELEERNTRIAGSRIRLPARAASAVTADRSPK